jgi:endonuclease VIII
LPEGDTIFRAVATLNRALSGSIVTNFETQLPALAREDIVGRRIEFARAAGKWLQIGFSDDLVLLTHMLMSGSWHIYRPGERWQKSRYHMRVVIETHSIVAVAFNVPIAEFHTANSLARRPGFDQRGPDILAPGFDEPGAVENLKNHPGLEIGVALLDQSILAGIGNMFKSEACFLAGVNPFEPIANLSTLRLAGVVSAARKMMVESVTWTRGPMWVYRRQGEPCRKCGQPIVARKQGAGARTSFWCPDCQRIK